MRVMVLTNLTISMTHTKYIRVIPKLARVAEVLVYLHVLSVKHDVALRRIESEPTECIPVVI